MKKLHLICNAHLDPVWLWDWEEGAAAALSTFRSAAQLAEEFDYIFCHNEAILYQWVEEYDSVLFERIRALVQLGKWKIMGGWYLQPDCNLPSGESFVRQIMHGRQYFQREFGVQPTTAINFDPFGHSVGLVQIMKKTGYDSYLICRPGKAELDVPDDFIWVGLDGSELKTTRLSTHYNSEMGKATEKIKAVASQTTKDVDAVLWGVGNHGGGPSRIDLQQIADMMGDPQLQLLHSTPEAYMSDSHNHQSRVERSLNPCMPGCYTSMVRIKQLHRELENKLLSTEKMCSSAALQGLMTYPHQELDEACLDLMRAEFHDILPGSSVPSGEQTGLRLLYHGLELVGRARARAFFSLTRQEQAAGEGEYPILVYNPHPYPVQTEIEVEFILANQNWTEKQTDFDVYYEGRQVPAQLLKESSNLSLDWAKRIVVAAELAPLGITRFNAKPRWMSGKLKLPRLSGDTHTFHNERMSAVLNLRTGLLDSYIVDGKEFIRGDAFRLSAYRDNADPWAMSAEQLHRLGSDPVDFQLMDLEESAAWLQVDSQHAASIRMIEDGSVLQEIEALFHYGNSKARVVYRFYYDNPEVEIKAELFFAEKDTMVRLRIPLSLDGQLLGQIAYGYESLPQDGQECTAQKWLVYEDADYAIAVVNDGIYGLNCESNEINLSLVRGAAYAAHPIQARPLLQQDRYIPRMDQGLHTYGIRITAGKRGLVKREVERMALLYNEKPYALNVFPSGGDGLDTASTELFELVGEQVVMTAFKQNSMGDYIIRLFNNSQDAVSSGIRIHSGAVHAQLVFDRYEIKTLRLRAGELTELDQLEI